MTKSFPLLTRRRLPLPMFPGFTDNRVVPFFVQMSFLSMKKSAIALSSIAICIATSACQVNSVPSERISAHPAMAPNELDRMNQIGAKLSDIASGKATRRSVLADTKNGLNALDAEIAQADRLAISSNIIGSIARAAMTGGRSMIEDGAALAQMAAGKGTVGAQTAGARAQQRAVIDEALSNEREAREGTTVDLPAQANALLEALSRNLEKTAWKNAANGHEGTIEIAKMDSSGLVGFDECRSATSMRSDEGAGALNLMLVCKRVNDWWLVN